VELTNEFEVAVPIDEAWAVLTDLERIAPCMPGAQLTEVEGDEYRGLVKVKVGPITASYKGAVRFAERDAASHRAVLKADGRETRGQGNASASITATLVPEGTGTKVSVFTDLAITGKVAQFGRGVLADVSGKLLDQFVHNLETTVLTPGAPATSGGAQPGGEVAAEAVGEVAATGSHEAPPASGAGDSSTSEAGDAAANGKADPGAASASAANFDASGAADADEASAAAGSSSAASSSSSTASAEASEAPSSASIRQIESAPAEAVDLMGVAGPSIAKRVVPFASAAGVLVLIRIILYAMKRRKR
jgi:carbon monoxide dehydrogenase subunit G